MPESTYKVEFLSDAEADLEALDHSQAVLVSKAIKKVAQNPLPQTQGGYGKPLRSPLAGLMKIKLRGCGLRVVYRLAEAEKRMEILVISNRDAGEAYDLAEKRFQRS